MAGEAASPSAAPPAKRARPQAGGGSRSKRKKVEEPVSDEEKAGWSGKRDEDGEVVTKIDFRDLPDETLYKYLELHDLLPTWSVSPWTEDPVGSPSTLYPSPSKRAMSPPKPPAKQDDPAASAADEDDDAPTTRSKTAPMRKEPTPPPVSKASMVLCLSDVEAAREILAEKANAHWLKGLGGGQNKESETIVNFLYKMKVGPGRLLRVYNPNQDLPLGQV